ncbi:hypothetical protein SMD44_08239 [Streptomyces alboflavus]|uniref:Uncharacterized protein n=1 Tax=Streptomyces alboflavus TaxID=67267 RepID=A0A1Z1WR10_9ACTN|nr:hypothetical protein SMD44_08239 [Streptomyces alboflavus]
MSFAQTFAHASGCLKTQSWALRSRFR